MTGIGWFWRLYPSMGSDDRDSDSIGHEWPAFRGYALHRVVRPLAKQEMLWGISEEVSLLSQGRFCHDQIGECAGRGISRNAKPENLAFPLIWTRIFGGCRFHLP
jgi:hypothetical protein